MPAASADPVRVLIVDDHELLRETLRKLLELDERLEVVAVAHDFGSSIAAARRTDVDVALVDMRLGGDAEEDGFAVVEALRDLRPETVPLMMTSFDARAYEGRALAAGARGIVVKTAIVRHGGDVVLGAFSAP
jgi:two-component system, NarL family, response regulator DevR